MTLMDETHSRIPGNPLQDSSGFVSRSIVHYNEFEVVECLIENAMRAFLHVSRVVVSGHDDGNAGKAYLYWSPTHEDLRQTTRIALEVIMSGGETRRTATDVSNQDPAYEIWVDNRYRRHEILSRAK